MSNYLEEFNKVKNGTDQRVIDVNNSIIDKKSELENTKILYKKAELKSGNTNIIDEANNLFKKVMILEKDIKQLESRKEILLEDAKGEKEKQLIELAETLKISNQQKMKNINAEIINYKKNAPEIELDFKRARMRNIKNINTCERRLLVAAGEIVEVLNYIPSYTAEEKNRIRVMGSDVVLHLHM